MKDLKDLSDLELKQFSELLEADYKKYRNSGKKDRKIGSEYTKLFKEVLAEIKKRKVNETV